jgi:hypothetical protein
VRRSQCRHGLAPGLGDAPAIDPHGCASPPSADLPRAHVLLTCRLLRGCDRVVPLRRGGRVRGAAVSLVALALAFAIGAPAAEAVSFDVASTAALKATQDERRGAPAILFGLRAPLRAGLAIKENGSKGRPAAGAGTRKMPVVLRVRGGSAYFFYLDLKSYQRYQHSGRVILVNRRIGRVRRSRMLSFQPVIGGKLAPFLRSRTSYELASYRVYR